jgi:hypothetical protein
MARTHEVTVDGIGTFVFRHRTLRDQIRIEAETLRVLGGPTEDTDLQIAARALASLIVLTQSAPDGWDLEAIDPLDPNDSERMFAVHRGLRQSEIAFRDPAKRGGAG